MSCPNSLCKWKPAGTLFRLSAAKPKYFVTCTNAGSVCRKCQDGMIFDTRNTVCVPQFRGSKHNVHKHVSHKHVSHRHVSHVSHHVRQHVTAPTAAPHKKADIECKIFFHLYVYFCEFSTPSFLKLLILRIINFFIFYIPIEDLFWIFKIYSPLCRSKIIVSMEAKWCTFPIEKWQATILRPMQQRNRLLLAMPRTSTFQQQIFCLC